MAKEPGTLGLRHYSFWQARLDDPCFVYVIRGGKKTPVKIGVAKKPLIRLKTLQTGNPQTLRLLLVVPGGEELERVLHERFAEHRLDASEWFYGLGVAQIIDFVTDLAVEMVQAYEEGMHEPPSLAGYPGWTDDERRALQPARVTIPMAPLPVDSAPVVAEQEPYNLVPTIRSQVCRTMLRARQHNGPCTQ